MPVGFAGPGANRSGNVLQHLCGGVLQQRSDRLLIERMAWGLSLRAFPAV